jgi:hypothetical protein
MYRVNCMHCNEHIYDYTEQELPKEEESYRLLNPFLYKGANGYPSLQPGDAMKCPACGGWLTTYHVMQEGPGYLGSFMKFEPKEEAASC